MANKKVIDSPQLDTFIRDKSIMRRMYDTDPELRGKPAEVVAPLLMSRMGFTKDWKDNPRNQDQENKLATAFVSDMQPTFAQKVTQVAKTLVTKLDKGTKQIGETLGDTVRGVVKHPGQFLKDVVDTAITGPELMEAITPVAFGVAEPVGKVMSGVGRKLQKEARGWEPGIERAGQWMEIIGTDITEGARDTIEGKLGAMAGGLIRDFAFTLPFISAKVTKLTAPIFKTFEPLIVKGGVGGMQLANMFRSAQIGGALGITNEGLNQISSGNFDSKELAKSFIKGAGSFAVFGFLGSADVGKYATAVQAISFPAVSAYSSLMDGYAKTGQIPWEDMAFGVILMSATFSMHAGKNVASLRTQAEMAARKTTDFYTKRIWDLSEKEGGYDYASAPAGTVPQWTSPTVKGLTLPQFKQRMFENAMNSIAKNIPQNTLPSTKDYIKVMKEFKVNAKILFKAAGITIKDPDEVAWDNFVQKTATLFGASKERIVNTFTGVDDAVNAAYEKGLISIGLSTRIVKPVVKSPEETFLKNIDSPWRPMLPAISIDKPLTPSQTKATREYMDFMVNLTPSSQYEIESINKYQSLFRNLWNEVTDPTTHPVNNLSFHGLLIRFERLPGGEGPNPYDPLFYELDKVKSFAQQILMPTPATIPPAPVGLEVSPAKLSVLPVVETPIEKQVDLQPIVAGGAPPEEPPSVPPVVAAAAASEEPPEPTSDDYLDYWDISKGEPKYLPFWNKLKDRPNIVDIVYTAQQSAATNWKDFIKQLKEIKHRVPGQTEMERKYFQDIPVVTEVGKKSEPKSGAIRQDLHITEDQIPFLFDLAKFLQNHPLNPVIVTQEDINKALLLSPVDKSELGKGELTKQLLPEKSLEATQREELQDLSNKELIKIKDSKNPLSTLAEDIYQERINEKQEQLDVTKHVQWIREQKLKPEYQLVTKETQPDYPESVFTSAQRIAHTKALRAEMIKLAEESLAKAEGKGSVAEDLFRSNLRELQSTYSQQNVDSLPDMKIENGALAANKNPKQGTPLENFIREYIYKKVEPDPDPNIKPVEEAGIISRTKWWLNAPELIIPHNIEAINSINLPLIYENILLKIADKKNQVENVEIDLVAKHLADLLNEKIGKQQPLTYYNEELRTEESQNNITLQDIFYDYLTQNYWLGFESEANLLSGAIVNIQTIADKIKPRNLSDVSSGLKDILANYNSDEMQVFGLESVISTGRKEDIFLQKIGSNKISEIYPNSMPGIKPVSKNTTLLDILNATPETYLPQTLDSQSIEQSNVITVHDETSEGVQPHWVPQISLGEALWTIINTPDLNKISFTNDRKVKLFGDAALNFYLKIITNSPEFINDTPEDLALKLNPSPLAWENKLNKTSAAIKKRFQEVLTYEGNELSAQLSPEIINAFNLNAFENYNNWITDQTKEQKPVKISDIKTITIPTPSLNDSDFYLSLPFKDSIVYIETPELKMITNYIPHGVDINKIELKPFMSGDEIKVAVMDGETLYGLLRTVNEIVKPFESKWADPIEKPEVGLALKKVDSTGVKIPDDFTRIFTINTNYIDLNLMTPEQQVQKKIEIENFGEIDNYLNALDLIVKPLIQFKLQRRWELRSLKTDPAIPGKSISFSAGDQLIDAISHIRHSVMDAQNKFNQEKGDNLARKLLPTDTKEINKDRWKEKDINSIPKFPGEFKPGWVKTDNSLPFTPSEKSITVKRKIVDYEKIREEFLNFQQQNKVSYGKELGDQRNQQNIFFRIELKSNNPESDLNEYIELQRSIMEEEAKFSHRVFRGTYTYFENTRTGEVDRVSHPISKKETAQEIVMRTSGIPYPSQDEWVEKTISLNPLHEIEMPAQYNKLTIASTLNKENYLFVKDPEAAAILSHDGSIEMWLIPNTSLNEQENILNQEGLNIFGYSQIPYNINELSFYTLKLDADHIKGIDTKEKNELRRELLNVRYLTAEWKLEHAQEFYESYKNIKEYDFVNKKIKERNIISSEAYVKKLTNDRNQIKSVMKQFYKDVADVSITRIHEPSKYPNLKIDDVSTDVNVLVGNEPRDQRDNVFEESSTGKLFRVKQAFTATPYDIKNNLKELDGYFFPSGVSNFIATHVLDQDNPNLYIGTGREIQRPDESTRVGNFYLFEEVYGQLQQTKPEIHKHIDIDISKIDQQGKWIDDVEKIQTPEDITAGILTVSDLFEGIVPEGHEIYLTEPQTKEEVFAKIAEFKTLSKEIVEAYKLSKKLDDLDRSITSKAHSALYKMMQENFPKAMLGEIGENDVVILHINMDLFLKQFDDHVLLPPTIANLRAKHMLQNAKAIRLTFTDGNLVAVNPSVKYYSNVANTSPFVLQKNDYNGVTLDLTSEQMLDFVYAMEERRGIIIVNEKGVITDEFYPGQETLELFFSTMVRQHTGPVMDPVDPIRPEDRVGIPELHKVLSIASTQKQDSQTRYIEGLSEAGKVLVEIVKEDAKTLSITNKTIQAAKKIIEPSKGASDLLYRVLNYDITILESGEQKREYTVAKKYQHLMGPNGMSVFMAFVDSLKGRAEGRFSFEHTYANYPVYGNRTNLKNEFRVPSPREPLAVTIFVPKGNKTEVSPYVRETDEIIPYVSLDKDGKIPPPHVTIMYLPYTDLTPLAEGTINTRTLEYEKFQKDVFTAAGRYGRAKRKNEKGQSERERINVKNEETLDRWNFFRGLGLDPIVNMALIDKLSTLIDTDGWTDTRYHDVSSELSRVMVMNLTHQTMFIYNPDNGNILITIKLGRPETRSQEKMDTLHEQVRVMLQAIYPNEKSTSSTDNPLFQLNNNTHASDNEKFGLKIDWSSLVGNKDLVDKILTSHSHIMVPTIGLRELESVKDVNKIINIPAGEKKARMIGEYNKDQEENGPNFITPQYRTGFKILNPPIEGAIDKIKFDDPISLSDKLDQWNAAKVSGDIAQQKDAEEKLLPYTAALIQMVQSPSISKGIPYKLYEASYKDLVYNLLSLWKNTMLPEASTKLDKIILRSRITDLKKIDYIPEEVSIGAADWLTQEQNLINLANYLLVYPENLVMYFGQDINEIAKWVIAPIVLGNPLHPIINRILNTLPYDATVKDLVDKGPSNWNKADAEKFVGHYQFFDNLANKVANPELPVKTPRFDPSTVSDVDDEAPIRPFPMPGGQPMSFDIAVEGLTRTEKNLGIELTRGRVKASESGKNIFMINDKTWEYVSGFVQLMRNNTNILEDPVKSKQFLEMITPPIKFVRSILTEDGLIISAIKGIRNLSASIWSDALDVTPERITKIMSGKFRPSNEEVDTLISYLRVPENYKKWTEKTDIVNLFSRYIVNNLTNLIENSWVEKGLGSKSLNKVKDYAREIIYMTKSIIKQDTTKGKILQTISIDIVGNSPMLLALGIDPEKINLIKGMSNKTKEVSRLLTKPRLPGGKIPGSILDSKGTSLFGLLLLAIVKAIKELEEKYG